MANIWYLFLCHNGEKRSPTASSIAREIAKEKNLDIEMLDGASNAIPRGKKDYASRYLSQYSKIIVMEKDISEKLAGLGVEKSRIFCLDIPDGYERHDEQLRKILREKLQSLI